MRNKINLLAATILGSLIALPVAAAPSLPKTIETGVLPLASNFGFWEFRGGCAVYYKKTVLRPNGRVGPPGYERYVEDQHHCLFSI